MSLKKCFKVFPQVVNYVNKNNSLFCRPILIHLNQNNETSFNSYNKIDVRFSATSAKKFEKNVKQVYYGVLTPQIRAVKVCLNLILVISVSITPI